jgi:chorismate mutase
VTIEQLRHRIDELDARLVVLLNARAECALEIGRLKEEMGLDLYQPDREREVLKNVRTLNRGPLRDEAVVRLFERIIDEARRLEREAKQQEELGSGDREQAAGKGGRRGTSPSEQGTRDGSERGTGKRAHGTSNRSR